jgi:Holliday junction resolvasome RuvABC DNA-binding subunit
MKNVQPSVSPEAVKRYEVVFGEQPKIPTKDIDVIALVNTLKTLGFNEKEAKQKINVAMRDGFKEEEEIIKYILSQR